MNYVLIGNSAAAVGCIEGIRSVDKEGKITVVAGEPYHTYARPLISYLLLGKTDEQRMKYRPDSFYTDNHVELLAGKTVTEIKPKVHKISLSDGTELPYDKLLVATGSRPFVPPMQGLELVEKKFSFMSLEDAKALQAAIKPDSKVLIIGAGLIGLKCAEGIMHSVKSITVCDLADRVLPSILNAEGSAMVQRHLEQIRVGAVQTVAAEGNNTEQTGIRFLLGDSTAEFVKNQNDYTAKMKSGTEVSFDVLVLCVGVRPNTSLVSEAGGEVNRGIIIEEDCKTSLPRVYAAGDCTEGYDSSIGAKRILALLPNAYMQGECAGINMAGGTAEYNRGIPMNAIGFAGLHIITAGTYEPKVKKETDSNYNAPAYYTDQSEQSYKLLFSEDNQLKGYILIGDVSRAGIYTSLIRNKTPLDSIDYELICKKPQLMAFTRKDRKEMLGL